MRQGPLETKKKATHQGQLLPLVAKGDGQRRRVRHAGEALRRIDGERVAEGLRQHGRDAGMDRVGEAVGGWRSETTTGHERERERAQNMDSLSHIHEAHAQPERAFCSNAQILEEEEDARFAMFVLETLRAGGEGAHERACIGMPRGGGGGLGRVLIKGLVGMLLLGGQRRRRRRGRGRRCWRLRGWEHGLRCPGIQGGKGERVGGVEQGGGHVVPRRVIGGCHRQVGGQAWGQAAQGTDRGQGRRAADGLGKGP